MDPLRLDTGEAMAAGVYDRQMPKTEIPEGREQVKADVERWGDDSLAVDDTERLILALDRGAVIDCPEYYGVVVIWKDVGTVYRGTLLQYRAVTEAPAFTSAADAVEWFADTARSVAG